MIDFRFISNVGKFLEDYEEAVDRAWEIIGLKAEGHAKSYCSVDTGRLRASINHATIAGGGDDVYRDDKGNMYSGRSAHVIPPHGECVLGTNVDYAVYQEFGTSKIKAAFNGRGFLRPAIVDHLDEYRKIMAEEVMKASR